MFLILLKYKLPLEVVDKYVAKHREYMGECYKKNYFVVSGPQIPRTGAVLISQLKDRKQVEEILQQDPYHMNEISEYEIIEFSPVLYHSDFSKFVAA